MVDLQNVILKTRLENVVNGRSVECDTKDKAEECGER